MIKLEFNKEDYQLLVLEAIQNTKTFFFKYDVDITKEVSDEEIRKSLEIEFAILEDSYDELSDAIVFGKDEDALNLIRKYKKNISEYLTDIKCDHGYRDNCLNDPISRKPTFLQYAYFQLWDLHYNSVWAKLKENKPAQQSEKSTSKLTMNRIALKYVYSGMQITRKSGNKIAKEYGHSSGEKLFQRFTYYSSSANRKAAPSPLTPTKLKNKINLIESVIELLPTDKQGRAKDEVSILKKIHEAEFQ